MAEKIVEVFVRTDDVGQNSLQGYQHTASCHLAVTCWKRVLSASQYSILQNMRNISSFLWPKIWFDISCESSDNLKYTCMKYQALLGK